MTVGFGSCGVVVGSFGTSDVGTGGELGVNVRNVSVVKTSDGVPTGGGVRVISVVGGRWVRMILVGIVTGMVVTGGSVAEADGPVGMAGVGIVTGSLVAGRSVAEADGLVGMAGVGSFVTVSEGTSPVSPNTSFALSLLTHPTLTPSAVFIGMAKHWC